MIGNSNDETNFPHKLLLTLLKIGLPLTNNILKPLARNTIRINKSRISNTCSCLEETFWISNDNISISNDDMNDIMKNN